MYMVCDDKGVFCWVCMHVMALCPGILNSTVTCTTSTAILFHAVVTAYTSETSHKPPYLLLISLPPSPPLTFPHLVASLASCLSMLRKAVGVTPAKRGRNVTMTTFAVSAYSLYTHGNIQLVFSCSVCTCYI